MRGFAGWDKERTLEVGLLALLAFLPLLFFWRVITPNVRDSATLARGDFIRVFYPFRHFVAGELWAGRIPLWNPYIYGGHPGLADIQTGTFYPLSLLTILLASKGGLPVRALEWEAIFHFSLAGIFTYLFVRRLLGNRFAAFVAGVTFAYGGYLHSFPITQLGILETAVWLPLVLLLLELGVSKGTVYFPLAGVAWAISLLAGHPQTWMHISYASLFYLAYAKYSRRGEPRTSLALGQIAAFVVTGLGLAAVQLLPTYELMGLSWRAEEVRYSFVKGGFGLNELGGVLVPVHLGSLSLYVGILPLALAIFALAFDGRNRGRFFWAALGLFSLLTSLGGNTFFYSLLYLLFPGFSRVRNQERGIILFSFAMAVLAGYGARYLTQPMSKGEKRGFQRYYRLIGWTLACLLLMAALLYYGWLGGAKPLEGIIPRYNFTLLILLLTFGVFHARLKGLFKRPVLQALVLGCILLDLFTISWEYNLAEAKAGVSFPETSAVRIVSQDAAGPFRFQSEGLLPHNGNASMVYGLEDVTGNSPALLYGYKRFIAEMKEEWTWWQLFNVRYILTQRYMGHLGLSLIDREGDLHLYQVMAPLPRAYVVHQFWLAASDDEFLKLLNSPQFDPRLGVILSEEPGLTLAGSEDGPSAVKFIHYSPNRLILEVELEDEGILVLSERYYPGWYASVDGRKVRILRANMIFRAIPLSEGRHRVEMVYAPLSFKLGLGISVATMLSIVGYLVWWSFGAKSWARIMSNREAVV